MGDWNLSLNRSLTEADLESWERLMADQHYAYPAEEGGDIVTWELEKTGMFSTWSFYRYISNGGLISRVDRNIWDCKVPSKFRIFLCRCITASCQRQMC